MLKIIERDSAHRFYNEFRRMAINFWKEKKDEFDNVGRLSSARVVYLLKDDVVIGGFFLTEEVANSFNEAENVLIAKNLSDRGYLNLTYFVISEKHRHKGFGTEFLSKYLKSCDRDLWITAKPEMKKFYEKLGFDSSIKRINNDNYILTLINHNK